ncbi:MAG: RNA polymerase subunit sigma-54 [Natronohydrobacter sp.]|nr:RNA polymerase subunit sigma-54 [Natronohydrobacter sp.]
MSLATRLNTRQSQAFRFGQVVDVLLMTGEQLDQHLLQTARDNPFLRVRQRRASATRGGNVHDYLDTGIAAAPSSLYAHVQSELAGLLAEGGAIGRLVFALTEALEPTGWLGSPIAEIAARLHMKSEIVEKALELVQRRVSPAGLFARNLRECLSLQLEDQGLLTEDMQIILDHLDILEHGGAQALADATGMGEQAVLCHLARLRRLDPKPGTGFATDPTLMREPDVRVEWRAGQWVAIVQSSVEAMVSVQAPMRDCMSTQTRQALAEARALKRAIDLRCNALDQILKVILAVQTEFFHHGPAALRPLSMSTIAQRTGFHPSTVSRVLNGLLVEGPTGIILARTLCPHSAAQLCESGPSKPQVLASLRQLLAHETPASPMSDQRLSEMLTSSGLSVSRRVIAKYRQELGFSSAAQRRRPN